MAKFFNQSDIDLFKECFFFIATRGFTQSDEELEFIMRSLSYSPTRDEVQKYYRKHEKDGKIDFASFLEVMHEHNMKENAMKEIEKAFIAHDRDRKGYVATNDVKNILLNLGERLSRREVDELFRDAGVNGSQLRYKEFTDHVCTPNPDY